MSRYELSPENLENQPRPADVDYDYWAKELKRIGGVNEYNGPNIDMLLEIDNTGQTLKRD